MTRLNVWNSCNRVLDEKLQESRQQIHRARLESIQNAHIHSRAPRGTTSSFFKAQPKSKSPAAKSRQAEIERENLKMIKTIVELQRSGVSRNGTAQKDGAVGKRRARPSSAAARCGAHKDVSSYEPNPLTGLAPGGDLGVPTAASHALYTRHSATMAHHFPEQNDIALNFVPGKRSTASVRQRTQAQIVNENRKILQRILSSKTTFSRATWQAQENERRKLLDNISRYSHLSKRCSAPSKMSTSPTARFRFVQGDTEGFTSTSAGYQRSPHQALVIVDHVNQRRLDLSNTIRTGSPVTHLRHRCRPHSASAASSQRYRIGCDADPLEDDVDAVAHAMNQLKLQHRDGIDAADDESDQREDE